MSSLILKPSFAAMKREKISSAKVADGLNDVAMCWLPTLEALFACSGKDLAAVRIAIRGLSHSLSQQLPDVRNCQSDAVALNTAAGKSISQLTVVSNNLTSDEAGLNVNVKNLQNDIHRINKKVARGHRYEEIGWVLGPLGHEMANSIGDLVDNVAGKRKELEKYMQKLQADEKLISELSVASKWYHEALGYARTLSAAVNSLVIAIQACMV